MNDLLRLAESCRIVVPNPQEVAQYLELYAQLAAFLPKICADVRQSLRADVELSLKLYKDPEIDDRYLTLYVRKEKYEHDILDRLERISERFNHRLEEIPGSFLLATDFSRPQEGHAV